jgi:hypothetical protein
MGPSSEMGRTLFQHDAAMYMWHAARYITYGYIVWDSQNVCGPESKEFASVKFCLNNNFLNVLCIKLLFSCP